MLQLVDLPSEGPSLSGSDIVLTAKVVIELSQNRRTVSWILLIAQLLRVVLVGESLYKTHLYVWEYDIVISSNIGSSRQRALCLKLNPKWTVQRALSKNCQVPEKTKVAVNFQRSSSRLFSKGCNNKYLMISLLLKLLW